MRALRLQFLLLLLWALDPVSGFVAPEINHRHNRYLSSSTAVASSQQKSTTEAAKINTNGDAPITASGEDILVPIEQDQGQSPSFSTPWNGYAVPKRYSTMLDEPRVSRLLKPRSIIRTDDEENEDGWGDLRKSKFNFLKGLLKMPLRFYDTIVRGPLEPGTLILVRHGESEWNKNKTFTGWSDPDLSERGKREVEHAARLLLEGGFEIDVVFTSRLKRAIRSTRMLLQEMNQVYLPVFKSWRLNERMYGKSSPLDSFGRVSHCYFSLTTLSCCRDCLGNPRRPHCKFHVCEGHHLLYKEGILHGR